MVVRSPADAVSPWSFEAVDKSGAGSCAHGPFIVASSSAPRGADVPDGGGRPSSPCRRSGGVKLEAAVPGGRRGRWEQPRQSRDGPVLPEGPGPVSETRRYTQGTGVVTPLKATPALTRRIWAGLRVRRGDKWRSFAELIGAVLAAPKDICAGHSVGAVGGPLGKSSRSTSITPDSPAKLRQTIPRFTR